MFTLSEYDTAGYLLAANVLTSTSVTSLKQVADERLPKAAQLRILEKDAARNPIRYVSIRVHGQWSDDVSQLSPFWRVNP